MPQPVGTALVTVVSAFLLVPVAGVARQHDHAAAPKSGLEIPASIRADHVELHAELAALSALPGKTGAAAKAVADALHPHFLAEEELAMPPLGLLHSLAYGTSVDAAAAVALTDRLRAAMPKMLEEHKAITAALDTLATAGKAENQANATRFAETLRSHAQLEEEVLYPAALLVGRHLKEGHR
jgi:hypothetical protein